MIQIIRDRIAMRIEELGTNASRASIETGLGRQVIRDILAGKAKSPTVATLQKVAVVLDCSVSFLIGETAKLHPDEERNGHGSTVGAVCHTCKFHATAGLRIVCQRFPTRAGEHFYVNYDNRCGEWRPA